MATGQQPHKRQLEVDQDAADSPAKRIKCVEAVAAAVVSQQKTGLSVPSLGEPVDTGTLLPALQQLLAVYKVEYWTALEEFRTRHQSFCGLCRQAVHGSEASGANDDSIGQAVADAPAVENSVRQLVQAALSPQQEPTSPAATPPPAQQQEDIAYGDDRCGHGSPQGQLPPPPAVQQLLLRLPPGPGQGVATTEQLQQWHERFKSASTAIAGLEQLASAASLQLMDTQGALACICGSSGRWIIRRTAVTIGRSSDTKGDVDVDLTKATTAAPANTASAGLGSSTPGVAATGGGFANIATAAETALGDARKVSRLQAQLSLELDGSWSLQNTGRAGVVVNGLKVPRGSKVSLPHLSLLDVGSEPLLFMVNGLAVQRAVARSSHLVM